MAIIPDFLIKRIYKKNSLKKENNTITFMLKNVLGPGEISGFRMIKINDTEYPSDKVKFISEGVELNAVDITENNPVKFRLGQEGKLILDGTEGLSDGENNIEIQAVNPEAGEVSIKIKDILTC